MIDVLGFILEYEKANGEYPSLRTIAQGLHTYVLYAHRSVNDLEKRGYLVRSKRQGTAKRIIQVTEKGKAFAAGTDKVYG